MSRFLTERYSGLEAYVPGEQPKAGQKVIKLNTNESPFPPAPGVLEAAREAAGKLNLYPDPDQNALKEAIARSLREEAGDSGFVPGPENIFVSNGSDDILNFAFGAFSDKDVPAVFPDVTYGFYKVFADLYGTPYRTIPLKDDWTVDPEDYISECARGRRFVVIAEPNAPTGIALGRDGIRKLLDGCRGNVVVVDEAYVDFGGETSVGLLAEYDNLIISRTFSKSYSLAGARLGFAVAPEALIKDLDLIKYSTNPYSVNRMTEAAGLAALAEKEYYMANCGRIAATRERIRGELEALGMEVLPSRTNFLFARHPEAPGAELAQALRERGIIVRIFGSERIKDFLRITIGTDEEMDALVKALNEALTGERR